MKNFIYMLNGGAINTTDLTIRKVEVKYSSDLLSYDDKVVKKGWTKEVYESVSTHRGYAYLEIQADNKVGRSVCFCLGPFYNVEDIKEKHFELTGLDPKLEEDKFKCFTQEFSKLI